MNFLNNWIILALSSVGWIIFIPFFVLPKCHFSKVTTFIFALLSFIVGVQQAKKAKARFLEEKKNG